MRARRESGGATRLQVYHFLSLASARDGRSKLERVSLDIGGFVTCMQAMLREVIPDLAPDLGVYVLVWLEGSGDLVGSWGLLGPSRRTSGYTEWICATRVMEVTAGDNVTYHRRSYCSVEYHRKGICLLCYRLCDL